MVKLGLEPDFLLHYTLWPHTVFGCWRAACVCMCMCCTGVCVPVHVNRGVSGGVCALTVTQASHISSPRLWVSRGLYPCDGSLQHPAALRGPGASTVAISGSLLQNNINKQQRQQLPGGEPPPSCLPLAWPSPHWAALGCHQQVCFLGPSDPFPSWHLQGASFGAAAPEKSFPSL